MKTFLALGFMAFTSHLSFGQSFTKPAYPGGETALNSFISEKLTYPVKAKEQMEESTIQVRLHINDEGEIYYVNIKECEHAYFENSIRAMLEEMPNWIPAKTEEKNIKAAVNLKIRFALDS